MNFKTYLVEEADSYKARTIKISKDTAMKYLKVAFNDSYLMQAPFYRGLENFESKYGYTDPTKQYKSSKETLDYYQYIIDTLPSWKGFPKRGYSIIGSTSPDSAAIYGDVYQVFPKNGAKFALAPHDDIWDSFSEPLQDWSGEFDDFLIGFDLGFEIADQKGFINACKVIDQHYKKIGRANFLAEHFPPNEKLYKGNMWQYFEYLFGAKRYNFKLAWTTDLLRYGPYIAREVWTDSPCILVKQ